MVIYFHSNRRIEFTLCLLGRASARVCVWKRQYHAQYHISLYNVLTDVVVCKFKLKYVCWYAHTRVLYI